MRGERGRHRSSSINKRVVRARRDAMFLIRAMVICIGLALEASIGWARGFCLYNAVLLVSSLTFLSF